jgi:hypothetical protein
VKGKLRLLLYGAGALLLLLIATAAFAYINYFGPPLLNFDPKDVPPITASPMDVSRIIYLSPFRSGIGHDYSYSAWDGETCRSMKHYFNIGQNQVNNMPVRSTPAPGETNINIYAPFDGTIISSEAENTPIGRQIRLSSAKNPSFRLKLFHIDLASGLSVGSKVSSGQVVGTIGPKDGTDVAYEAQLVGFKTVYLSIFDYMTDQAFVPYAALGYKRSDFVLTREQADANGYKCNGEKFVQQAGPSGKGGYIQIHPNPYPFQFMNQR